MKYLFSYCFPKSILNQKELMKSVLAIYLIIDQPSGNSYLSRLRINKEFYPTLSYSY